MNEPIEYENMVVMDMRYYFGLAQEDVLKGASTITWPELLDVNENLWKMASNTSEIIKKLRNENQGLIINLIIIFLIKCHNKTLFLRA